MRALFHTCPCPTCTRFDSIDWTAGGLLAAGQKLREVRVCLFIEAIGSVGVLDLSIDVVDVRLQHLPRDRVILVRLLENVLPAFLEQVLD
jgi:hypothetical protein